MKIDIFDTTLRDGEQTPGVSLNQEEKLILARQLEKLGVDVIEAGFPAASPGDFKAVSAIAKEIQGATICALARANEGDIISAVEAIKGANRPRAHIFISTSPIHIQEQLGIEPEAVIEMAKKSVALAKSFDVEVEFSPMDATRSEIDFLLRVCQAAESEGADIINLPDTVGYATPLEYRQLFEEASKALKTPLSAHCHNDLGLAVANSLAAIDAGAKQVEVSMNGLGERAGNCPLEEIVIALKTRDDFFKHKTSINFKEIATTSRLVSLYTGYMVPANKAIVGKNAFAHESGIHQDGVLKNRETYEIIDPEEIGVETNHIVLGKHSGRHALKDALSDLGYNLDSESLNKCFKRFKELADAKKQITTLDLEALVSGNLVAETNHFDFIEVKTGSAAGPRAEVVVVWEGKSSHGESSGDGAVDALFSAIQEATGIDSELNRYTVDSIGRGRDSLAEVVVFLEKEGTIFSGRAVGPDTIRASGEAYLRAISKI